MTDKPLTVDEQSVFEEWLREESPSGCVEQVQEQWLAITARSNWQEEHDAAQTSATQAATRCKNCDDSGQVTSITGEWRGRCHCGAGRTASPMFATGAAAPSRAVAEVPIHPRNGPLWANVRPIGSAGDVPSHYPRRPLRFADEVSATAAPQGAEDPRVTGLAAISAHHDALTAKAEARRGRLGLSTAAPQGVEAERTHKKVKELVQELRDHFDPSETRTHRRFTDIRWSKLLGAITALASASKPWSMEQQPDGSVNAVDPVDLATASTAPAIPLSCRDSHEASLKYVEGYEAGKAAASTAPAEECTTCRGMGFVDGLGAVCEACSGNGSSSTAPAAVSPDAPWLFIQMTDDGEALPTWCRTEDEIRAAVASAVYVLPLELDDDATEQVKGITESLIEDGFFDFEGDPGLKLFRIVESSFAAATQAPSEPQAVPAGLWLAPMEPDETMLQAGEGWPATTMPKGAYRRMRDSWISRHPQQAPSSEARDAEPEPLFFGCWHHGQGNLCCGTMRYLRADFDTQPAPEVREAIFNWICTTMNAALDRWRAQRDAALAREQAGGAV